MTSIKNTGCYYCDNDFSYEGPVNIEETHLIECDVCRKKTMGVYCPKCKLGGIIIPEGGDFLMGKVDDFSKRPGSWRCNNCKNDWRIPQEVYDRAPIVAVSDMLPEWQAKKREEITKYGLTVKKLKGPKFLVIFLFSLVATLISPTIGSVVTGLFIVWSFFAFLNRKTFMKVMVVVILGSILGSLISFKISKKKDDKVVTVPDELLESVMPTGGVNTGLFDKSENIVGSWIEAGTDYPEKKGHYEFFENGEFQYNIGAGVCVIAEGQKTGGKELSYQGRWTIGNSRIYLENGEEKWSNNLTLTPLSRTVLISGARAIEKEACGTKEQRTEAVIKNIETPGAKNIVFEKGECTKPGYADGCQMFTEKGERLVRTGFNPEKVEILEVDAKNPLIFGKYKINLPKGWGWQKKIEGISAEVGGPGTYCSDPDNFATDYWKASGMKFNKCSYSIIKDLSENCPNCPGIMIADIKGLTMGGGGYIPTVNETKKLGTGKYLANYHISWEAEGVTQEGKEPTVKLTDSNGDPRLYYVEGCPRNDLCIYFNNTYDNRWQYEKIRDFINQVVIENYNWLNKDNLVGIWQASSVMAAGWADRYNFYPSGKYSFNGTTNGYWELKNNILVLKEVEKSVLTGKTMERKVVQCASPEVDNYPCVTIDQTDYYKFGDDPFNYVSENFPEPGFGEMFSGKWEYKADGDVYFLQLEQNVYNEDLAGTHCFTTKMGNKNDCNRVVTIKGKIAGNKATVSLESAFDGSITAELEVTGNKMNFTTKTPGEVVPAKIILTKIK